MVEDHVVTRRRGKILGPQPPQWADCEEYGLHEHTIDQEYRTLCNRHLFKTPEPQRHTRAWKCFTRQMRKLSKLIGRCPRATVKEVMGTRSSMKRKRFGGGMERYCRYGVRRQDSFLTEMQKLEFYPESKLETKEDRGIQFRNPTYNAALARQLYHSEHRLYARARNVDGTPMIAKGRSPLERGLILAAMAKRFAKPLFILMDHSRFDAHVNRWLLKEEHDSYRRERGYDPELDQLLQWQSKNIGFTQGGICYKIEAKRCSGDINTGGGNTKINLSLIKGAFASENIPESAYSVFLDGDDSVVIVEEGTPIPDFAAYMLKCGMVTEVQMTNKIEEAEFCQSRICWGKLGPVMVRNPMKVLDVVTKSPRALDDRQARGVLAASALGELMQAPGVPVIAPAAASLVTMAASLPRFTTPDAYERFMVYKTDRILTTVDDTMRVSFEEAWGISVAEQHALELYYTSMADMVKDIPPIVPPKPKRSCDSYETWDDCVLADIVREEKPWWLDEYPLGEYVRGC